MTSLQRHRQHRGGNGTQQVIFQMWATPCWLQTPPFLAEAVERHSTKLMLSQWHFCFKILVSSKKLQQSKITILMMFEGKKGEKELISRVFHNVELVQVAS